MKTRSLNVSLAGMGILFLGLLFFAVSHSAVCLAAEDTVDCDIQSGGCQKQINGRTVDLNIFPKPVKAMQDLTFQVKISGAPLGSPPFIDLGMPGMKMGRCKSGRTIWQAAVTLPDAGRVVFTFDVVY
jgi:hypothetical protein